MSVDAVKEVPAKKRKVEDGDTVTGKEYMFHNFVFDRVLNENSQRKLCFVTGHFLGSEDKAVVTLEKTPFREDTIKGILSEGSRTKETLRNDIYGTFQVQPNPDFNDLKASLIYPATEKHIAKYTAQDTFLVHETPEDYNNITLPFLKAENFSIQWVYNILQKKTESDRIVFEESNPETGFILLPDMKWDRKQMDDLYLVAIVHKHDIKSLRDLNADHLPLLKNIFHEGQAAILEKFGVPSNKLRIYVHYQPSYYHFHVHFTHLKYDAPGSGVERAHLLSDIIDNIEMDEAFYQKKTLSFVVKETEELCKRFKEASRL